MIDPRTLHLFDTNVLVHFLRGKAAGAWLAENFELTHRASKNLISVVSLGELLALAEKWKWKPAKRLRIYELLQSFVLVDIHHEVVLERYARLSVHWEQRGKRMEQNDLWIAASAQAAGAAIVTTDGDFKKLAELTPVEWVDPIFLKGLR